MDLIVRCPGNQGGFHAALICSIRMLAALALLVGAGLSPPAANAQQSDTLYFSTVGAGSIPGVSSPYDDADVYAFKDPAFARTLDAITDLRLPSGANLDALSWVRPGLFYVSFANTSVTVPGFGAALDEQVLKYEDGAWSLYFDGATCGLNVDGNGDIDAIAVAGDALYFSTLGNLSVSGLGAADDGDVYTWAQGAANCTRVLDASALGLLAHADIDGLDLQEGRF